MLPFQREQRLFFEARASMQNPIKQQCRRQNTLADAEGQLFPFTRINFHEKRIQNVYSNTFYHSFLIDENEIITYK